MGMASANPAAGLVGCPSGWDQLLPLLPRHVVNKVRVTRPDVLHPMHREAAAAGDSA